MCTQWLFCYVGMVKCQKKLFKIVDKYWKKKVKKVEKCGSQKRSEIAQTFLFFLVMFGYILQIIKMYSSKNVIFLQF